jgi:transcriptional regulator with XRE-family HTH domain
MDSRTEIRDFLISRRAKITPEQAGLPAYGGHRRVPGLRREEVALLAGMSVDYYTRLERGNAGGVSDSVLDALARALHLDEAERQHLFDLAHAINTPAAWTSWPATSSAGPSSHRSSPDRAGLRTSPGSSSSTPPPGTSTSTGSNCPPTPSRSCAPKRAATPTTGR